jgi:cellulose synthase/poly-beta-1,6-N-acetylglucosamine synthase-like glycosyltransferase
MIFYNMSAGDWVDLLFLLAIVTMWIILFYHSFLVWVAYDFFLKSRARLEENLKKFRDYPLVTVLVPAHNEEIVISRTLESLLDLDYPADKLQIIPINDQSTDRTGEIIDRYAREYKQFEPFHTPKGEGGRGKARTLNLALERARGNIICVFDADNNPEPTSVKYLVAELMSDPKLGAVCGKVRTQNRKKNLLTRFINLEYISHQWMIQGGRWHLHKFAMIPGTNFVIRKEILDKLNGWDEKALTEDAELTFQIRKMDYLISFNPFAITWEQEPETWPVWFRQRLRWLQGNRYIVKKYLRPFGGEFKIFKHIIYMVGIYRALFYMVIASDVLFVLGIFDVVRVSISGPIFLTWVIGFLLFVTTILVTLSFEETSENNWENFGSIILMYFIYCQMWVLLIVRGLLSPLVDRRKDSPFWVKTPRVHLDRRLAS